MFEVGAVRKARRLTRICVVLGVILLFSSIGMTLTAAAPNENAPGQDQCNEGHGANNKPCTTDPAAGHGQDCEEHGKGGVNENHCDSEGGTTGGSTGGSSTGEATGNATGNSTDNGTGNSTGNGTGNSTGEGTTGETTGSTSGSSTGSTSGTGTGSPVVESNDLEDEVLGRVVERAPLATTGSTTTLLAVFGVALLLIGSFLRFGRFGYRVAVAAASPADELIVKRIARAGRTVRRVRVNKRCD